MTEVSPLGLPTEGTTISIEDSEGVTTFEFVRLADLAEGNIGIAIVDAIGTPLTANVITATWLPRSMRM